MATPQSVVLGPKAQIVIRVYADPATQEIYVDREPFYVHVSKEEEVEWRCMQSHDHGDGAKCFTVEFNGPNKTPFETGIFHGNGARTGLAKVRPDKKKFYKYTLTVPGVGVLDPQGGVTP